jgi:hypothetical protein
MLTFLYFSDDSVKVSLQCLHFSAHIFELYDTGSDIRISDNTGCTLHSRKVDQKYLENSEMWCWRRMQKISWTDRARNEEVLHRVKEERNVLHTVKRRKANWIGHILRRNCLLKHVTEGKVVGRIEVTGRRGSRITQLRHNLNEKSRYCKLKEEALDRTLCRTCFGSGYGPVVRQIAET